MRENLQTLRRILTSVVEAMGYEWVGMEFHPRHANALLRIYIDSATGITLDDCQRVSHQVSGVLDVEDLIAGQYTLEVSSPGVDRPLKTARDFLRHVGRKVKVTYRQEDQSVSETGTIESVEGSTLHLSAPSGKFAVSLDQIQKAVIMIEF